MAEVACLISKLLSPESALTASSSSFFLFRLPRLIFSSLTPLSFLPAHHALELMAANHRVIKDDGLRGIPSLPGGNALSNQLTIKPRIQ